MHTQLDALAELCNSVANARGRRRLGSEQIGNCGGWGCGGAARQWLGVPIFEGGVSTASRRWSSPRICFENSTPATPVGEVRPGAAIFMGCGAACRMAGWSENSPSGRGRGRDRDAIAELLNLPRQVFNLRFGLAALKVIGS